MEPLSDAQREARVAARVDELYRNLISAPYMRRNGALDLDDHFAYFGGSGFADGLRRGDVSVRDVVAAMRLVYLEVLKRKKVLGAVGLLRFVQEMPEQHPLGFSPRMVGWMAARDALDEEQLRLSVRTRFGAPPNPPKVQKAFWDLGLKRGFTRKHDPRKVFEVLARMELEPEKHDVGRKRRQRAHKGVNRRGWKTSAFYSQALLDTLHEATGVPVRTLRTLLREVDYFMPLEWTLV